ncbi:MAG: helix-turn-helix domain-containing protein [Armatimonadota bacterium]
MALFYRTCEIAEIFHVDPWTARKWLRQGRLPAVKINGQYRVPAAVIAKMIEDRETAAALPTKTQEVSS